MVEINTTSAQGSDQVANVSCAAPEHNIIAGQYVDLIPTITRHATELYEAVGGQNNVALFSYMPYGPFEELQPFQDRISVFQSSRDPLFWTIRHRSSGKMLGWLSLLRIDTVNRVVEIGHIMYAPSLQRTTAATEAWYLLADKAVGIHLLRIVHRHRR